MGYTEEFRSLDLLTKAINASSITTTFEVVVGSESYPVVTFIYLDNKLRPISLGPRFDEIAKAVVYYLYDVAGYTYVDDPHGHVFWIEEIPDVDEAALYAINRSIEYLRENR